MQFNVRMILLSLLPSLLALGLWAVLLFLTLQPLIDFLQQNFVATSSYQLAGNILTFLGLFALKAFIVPLMAMWLLLPLMLTSALIFVAVVAMPLVNRSISRKYFPELEKKHGASWARSAVHAVLSLMLFLCLWLISLPLSLLLHAGLIVQPILVGWFTCRVMAYDAMAAHASIEERQIITRQHRWQLWTVGIISGVLGTLPGMVWLGGVLWIVVLPFFAAIAIWLYVLVFMFSGIWFQLFCLDALQHLRQSTQQAAPSALQSELS